MKTLNDITQKVLGSHFSTASIAERLLIEATVKACAKELEKALKEVLISSMRMERDWSERTGKRIVLSEDKAKEFFDNLKIS